MPGTLYLTTFVTTLWFGVSIGLVFGPESFVVGGRVIGSIFMCIVYILIHMETKGPKIDDAAVQRKIAKASNWLSVIAFITLFLPFSWGTLVVGLPSLALMSWWWTHRDSI